MENDSQDQDRQVRRKEMRGALVAGCSMWAPIVPPVCEAKDVTNQGCVALDDTLDSLSAPVAANNKESQSV